MAPTQSRVPTSQGFPHVEGLTTLKWIAGLLTLAYVHVADPNEHSELLKLAHEPDEYYASLVLKVYRSKLLGWNKTAITTWHRHSCTGQELVKWIMKNKRISKSSVCALSHHVILVSRLEVQYDALGEDLATF